MKKNVLLIVLPYMQVAGDTPSTKMKAWLALPYGLLSIATYNKDVANIGFIDCNVHHNYLELIKQTVDLYKPDIIGFSMTFDHAYNQLPAILDLLKDVRAIKVIGGAATLSSYRDILAEQPGIDAVCYGDGELPMKAMIEDSFRAYSEHPSWITRPSLRMERVPFKTPVPDLNNTLALDYSFIDVRNYSLQEEFSPNAEEIEDKKRFFMLTSRGCPYRCAFCYKSREKDRKMRYASVDKVIDHTKYLIDTYGMNILTFCDDQILFNMKRAKEIFRRLEQFHIRVEVYQGVSVGFIDDEMADLMHRAGMVRAMLNIESGSQHMLDTMIEKPVNLDHAKEVIQTLRKHNIWASAIFVVGFPGETDELRRETMNWIAEADLDWCVFNAAIPIRGTKLYDICIENGYIKPDKLGKLDYGNYTINVPGYPPEYVADQVYMMNLEANFVNNRSMRVGDYETAAIMFRQVVGIYPNHAFAWYYLTICYNEIGDVNKAIHSFSIFSRIVGEDPKWATYARRFGIGG